MSTTSKTIDVNGFPTGETVFYRVVDAATPTATYVARTSTGVVEFPSGSGTYAVTNASWNTTWAGRIIWDDGVQFASETFEAESTSSGGGGGTGTGDVTVDHNYGGTDALRVLGSDSAPVDAAIIRAFVAADYAAGTIDSQPPTTLTGSDGRWVAPLMLDADTYTITVWNPLTSMAKNFTLTVT